MPKDSRHVLQKRACCGTTQGERCRVERQIEQNYVAYFSSKPAQERHVTLIRHVRFLRPEVAVIDGHVEIWRQQELRLHLLATFVMTKEDGQWLVSDVYLMVPVT